VVLAKHNQYTIAREDLTGLIENLRKLPKDRRTALLILSRRKLEFWTDWQAEKHGVPVTTVEPKGTSTTCPRCNSKMKENSYGMLRCEKCGLEADRDAVAALSIEKRALSKMRGASGPPSAPLHRIAGHQGSLTSSQP